jgi:hypothetical protein
VDFCGHGIVNLRPSILFLSKRPNLVLAQVVPFLIDQFLSDLSDPMIDSPGRHIVMNLGTKTSHNGE